MSRLIDQGPYREVADMPEVKIKKEWYCTLPKWSDERSLVIGIFAVLFVIWAIAVAVAFLIGEPALDAAPFLLRGLIIIIVYVMLCAAFFLRRREVRE